ncbi:alpha/beta fold hydrolase [Salinisphaera sp. SPP-AMP-43]|uniref:alpha/beta fold hydrolase n=1 Tax=Salinisphaera sp. SPP-AMP-43 TaxID=3121288 RepID=UPI003C6DF69C
MKTDRRPRLFDRRGVLLPGCAEFEVIHRRAGATLRYYAPAPIEDDEPSPRSPLVLVPPLGVDTRIYDRRDQHSLVAYLSARGFDLYLIDWGRPTRADDQRHLGDYFAALLPEMLNRVRFHSGHRALSLHGWQLGGVFALCCAALSSPDEIAHLVLLDTAIDYRAAGAAGLQPHALWQRAAPWRRLTGLRASRLPVKLLHTPGWLQGIARQVLYGPSRSHADEELMGCRAYPGGVVADIIDYLWADNLLAQGQLPMAGTATRLAAVHAPILHLCDRSQPVCSAVCGQRLASVVASREVISEWVEPDSTSSVGGALTAQSSWAQVADWLMTKQGDR